ncbi:hypothetical protein Agub_g512, partial [Astrephomene gubernaculifera]
AVMLLSSLGVPDAVLEARQAAHLAELAHMGVEEEVALKYLLAANKVDEAELLAEYGMAPAAAGGLRLEAVAEEEEEAEEEDEAGRQAAAAARRRVRRAVLELQREEVDRLVKELPPLRPRKAVGQQQAEQAGEDEGEKAVAGVLGEAAEAADEAAAAAAAPAALE